MSGPLGQLAEVQRQLLLLDRFDARDNNLLHPRALTDKIAASQDQISAALQDFALRGWVAQTARKGIHEPLYEPTHAGWQARESYLREHGLRHRSLVDLPPNLIAVVSALLMAGHRENGRLSGGQLGRSALLTRNELAFYLQSTSSDQVAQAIDAGLQNGLFRHDTKLHRDVGMESCVHVNAFAITEKGRREYEDEFSRTLGLAPAASILDLELLETIDVFNSWQSEFNPSRSAINAALEAVVEHLNAVPGLLKPLRIVQASAPGDGATRIDSELLSRIASAHFFVGDLTPVCAYGERLCLNNNVLVEVGYALASKRAEQILLLSKRRPELEKDGGRFAFDLAHVRRHAFDGQPDLKKRLTTELRSMLERKGWIPAADGE